MRRSADLRSRLKDLLLSLALTAGSVVFTLLVLEVVLRFMPVSTGLASMPVNAASPVFHFTPNRLYVYSHGWQMERVRRGRANNEGWIDAQDYRRDDPSPLLAVIGDSYVEGLMVPEADTVQARLARTLAGKLRVYSFAASGAPLSQYLIWAGHAVHEYGARGSSSTSSATISTRACARSSGLRDSGATRASPTDNCAFA